MTLTVNLWMSAMKKSKVFGIVLLAVAPMSLVGGAVFRNPYPVLVAMAGLGLVPLASKLATGAETWDEAVEHRRAPYDSDDQGAVRSAKARGRLLNGR